MNALYLQLLHHGLGVVFLNVFLEQIGLPIPALPTLIVAGSLAARGRLPLLGLLGMALLGSVLADTVWYLLGRWRGRKVLKTVCRISLSPDTCVRDTETLFERRGLVSLLFAKFIPGYNTVAPPLAGAMGTSLPAFLLWDALGSLLWIGSGVAAGWIFRGTVTRVLRDVETMGLWALALAGAVLFLVIAGKRRQRRRFHRLLHLARITVPELQRLIESGHAPAIVDVRMRSHRLADPRRIPGALRMTLEEIDERMAQLPRDGDIVLYCT
jgi:membrane protein DedA with SNARE-associated domain